MSSFMTSEFPDMTASIWADVLRQCDNDKKKAKDLLRGLGEQAEFEKRKERERKVMELEENFRELGREKIESILEQNDWNEEKAILPLFLETEKLKEEERRKREEELRKKREEERREKEKEAIRQANAFLKHLFSAVPETQIQQILEENDGDVDATTDQLLRVVTEMKKKEQEEEHKKIQEKREKELKIEALVGKFDNVERSEVISCLEKNDWDVKITSATLLKLSEDRKENQLKALYKSFSEEEIKETLAVNNWNVVEATRELGEKRAERRRRKEEEERERLKKLREKVEEERKKLEEERERVKRLAECEMREREEIEKKKKIELEQLEQLRLQRENEERQREQERELQKAREEEEERRNREKKFEDFATRSLLVAEELEQILQHEREREKENDERSGALALFKRDLEDKLRFGTSGPGFAHLRVKMNKNSEGEREGSIGPVEEDREDEGIDKSKSMDSSASSPVVPSVASSVLNDADQVVAGGIQLSLSSKRVDPGQTIFVSWEVKGEEAIKNLTSSDWIGLYPYGAESKNYITYQWIGKPSLSGTLSFQAPNIYGVYNFRFLSNRQYAARALSDSFCVGPEINLYPAKKESSSSVSHELLVRWEQVSGAHCPNAWIGLYEAGSGAMSATNSNNNKQYYAYTWAGGSAEARKGEVSFVVPKAGVWEFRFFPQRSYDEVARASILVEGEDELRLNVEGKEAIINYKLSTVEPVADSAWIGLFKVEEKDNRQWRRYRYLSAATGEIRFKAPIHTGTYEARLFAHKNYSSVLSISNSVHIEGIPW